MKKLNMRTVFLSSTIFLFALNIVVILIFRNNINVSVSSLIATTIFIILFIRGILACIEKNEQLLVLSKYYTSKFYRYNQPTQKQLQDFYLKATIYFAVLPFYLPVAAFSLSPAFSSSRYSVVSSTAARVDQYCRRERT